MCYVLYVLYVGEFLSWSMLEVLYVLFFLKDKTLQSA